MFDLHENGIGRTRLVVAYLLSVLPSLAVLGSGVSKFFPDTEIHLLLRQLAMDDYALPIELLEIAVVVLYWIPLTSNLGFFLFCTYVGAILMAELVIGDVPLPALTIGAMVFAGTLLRKPSLLG